MSGAPELLSLVAPVEAEIEVKRSRFLARLEPVLDLGMRLGEGSGAVAALPVLRSGIAVLRDVALLSEILPS